MWDVASMLAAIYSARQLGFIDDSTYSTRMQRILQTLSEVKLYDNRMFNKAYDVRDGEMVKASGGGSDAWEGWSATDLGRLLIWLKIVAVDAPELAELAETVAHRVDESRVIRDGYLHGETLNDSGRVSEYQEGRIGYEQYVARGFAEWGADVANALMRAGAKR